jgi:hypothetical protein
VKARRHRLLHRRSWHACRGSSRESCRPSTAPSAAAELSPIASSPKVFYPWYNLYFITIHGGVLLRIAPYSSPNRTPSAPLVKFNWSPDASCSVVASRVAMQFVYNRTFIVVEACQLIQIQLLAGWHHS